MKLINTDLRSIFCYTHNVVVLVREAFDSCCVLLLLFITRQLSFFFLFFLLKKSQVLWGVEGQSHCLAIKPSGDSTQIYDYFDYLSSNFQTSTFLSTSKMHCHLLQFFVFVDC